MYKAIKFSPAIPTPLNYVWHIRMVAALYGTDMVSPFLPLGILSHLVVAVNSLIETEQLNAALVIEACI